MNQNLPIKKTGLQILLLISVLVFMHLIAASAAPFFAQYIFLPLQILRCWCMQWIPFSIGDLCYAIAGFYMVYLIALSVKKIRGISKKKILITILHCCKKFIQFYIILFLLWGIYYEQPKLAKQLSLNIDQVSSAELISFDSLLIQRLNQLQPQWKMLDLNSINQIAASTYRKKQSALYLFVKPTLMGNTLAYFGIEGYFNPFTGEAQVNKYNPNFMQPFVVAHEMAHQTGIAAEDDANLLAYIACVESAHTSFQYSAYFNIWLYTHRKVNRLDSTIANNLKRSLNVHSLAQLDTLKERSRQYHTFWDDASSFVFDSYLKLGNQKDGIGSYKNVAYSALCWERKQRLQH